VDWLKERKNRRIIPHRFETVGYVPVRNKDADSAHGGSMRSIATTSMEASSMVLGASRPWFTRRPRNPPKDQPAAVERLAARRLKPPNPS
jgi:hypothetical protein